MGSRRRLDVEMVRRGIVPSRAQAAAVIEEGNVLVAGTVADKASRLVAPAEPIELQDHPRFVSRGGLKLEAAIVAFGIDVDGLPCLDAGASTGGFTDCLLQRGAARVVAVDVGRGQLHPKIRNDPRVTVLEGLNIRHLTPEDVGDPPAIVTADLSFISLATVTPALREVAAPDARFVFLVKPQFEAGRARVGRGGVIRDPRVHEDVLAAVNRSLAAAGLGTEAVVPSPVRGAQGNIEFLLALRRDTRSKLDEDGIAAVVVQAHEGLT